MKELTARVEKRSQTARLAEAAAFAAALCLSIPASLSLASAASNLTTPGIVREFSSPLGDVRQAVLAVQRDHIIHGTLVFDKEPILNGAEAVNATPMFDPWKGEGEVYYKIRKNAVAPRHFLETGDQGTIAVRYVIIPVKRRVKPPGADLKAAPFQSAAALKTLSAYTEVVILIVTPHWLGIETPEGQRGWLPVESLEPLP